MKPVFADTFYWIALSAPADAAHERANQFKGDIVTIDEVLAEYLTFFSTAPQHARRQAAFNVQDILDDSAVRVIPAKPGIISFGTGTLFCSSRQAL